MPVTVLVTEVTEFRLKPDADESLGWLCSNESRQSFEALPIGDLYFVNYDAGWLAKTEFNAQFHENGILKSISINGDPSQVVESSAGLIEAALPIAFPDRIAEAEGLTTNNRDLSARKKQNCLKTKTTRTVERFKVGG